MQLEIRKSKTVSEIKSAFNAGFPYLKIEFFTEPHEAQSASWSKYMVFDAQKKLSEIGLNTEGVLTITDKTITRELEQYMRLHYGLNIQVFRRSMGTWIESTKSDSWTLGEQNERGRESATTAMEMVYTERSNDDAVN